MKTHTLLLTDEEMMAILEALLTELVNMRRMQKTAAVGELSNKFTRRMLVTQELLRDFKNKAFR